MGCWDDLNLTLKFEILHHVPQSDVFKCQSVSRSFRQAAVHIYYQRVTINNREQAIAFIKGQLQAIEPRGGLFVYSLDITGAYIARSSADTDLVSMQLFATTCPNVQYLVGDSRSWQFWASMKKLFPDHHWLELKHIPFSFIYSADYLLMSLAYRNSLTHVSVRSLPKEVQSKQLAITDFYQFIRQSYPRVEILEIFQRRIKHVFELDQINQFLPNLRVLITDRGRQPFMQNPPRDVYFNIKARGQIVPHARLERLEICLPKLDYDSIGFIALKFPAVKWIDLMFDKVASVLSKDKKTLALLLMYVLSRETYTLVFPVDCPAFALGEIFNFYDRSRPPPNYHRLAIKYGPNQYNTSRRKDEQYCPNVVLSQEQPGRPGITALEYVYFPNDELFFNVVNQVFEFVGMRLTELDINMSSGYIHTVGTEMMNGYFLDSLIFKCCRNLQYLRLQHFHLVRCNPATAMPLNESIWQLQIINSHLYNGAILEDISLRLPNLRQLRLDSCMWSAVSTITNVILSHSHLESLSIVDTLKRGAIFVKWVIVEVENRRKMYGRSAPEETVLVECENDDFTKTYVQTDYMLYIRCKSVQRVSLHSQQLHLSCELDIA